MYNILDPKSVRLISEALQGMSEGQVMKAALLEKIRMDHRTLKKTYHVLVDGKKMGKEFKKLSDAEDYAEDLWDSPKYEDSEISVVDANDYDDILWMNEDVQLNEKSSSMMKQYRDNEDNNLHAKNLEMLAKAFGSPAEKKYASEKAKWESSLTDKDFKVDRAMEKKINSYFNRLSENVRIDEKIRMFPKTQAKIMARGNQQDAQDYNYSMNLDKQSINPEDRESIPAQKKARGRHARAAMRYGRIARGEPAFKKSPNDPKSKWTNEEFDLLVDYLLDEGYTIDDIQNMTDYELNEKIRMFPKTQAKIRRNVNQQDAQSYNYSMNLDKQSINPEDRASIPDQKKKRGIKARAAMRYGRIARGEPAFKKSPNDPKSNWANEEVNLLANYLLGGGYTVRDIQNMTEQELRYAMNEAKMENAEILKAAKALAENGKDEKTKSFGKGLVSFYEKNESFTPDQVAGLQNIMKNAPFQMAKKAKQ